MRLALLLLAACGSPPSRPAPPPPSPDAFAPLVAQIGPHLRAVVRLDLASRAPLLDSLLATLGNADAAAACHASLKALRVAVGEPLRVAAELDGDVDAARLKCLLGDRVMALATQVGLAITDRPGGVAIARDLQPGHADARLVARCTGASCLAAELGPATHVVHAAFAFGARATTFRIDGADFTHLVAAVGAEPELAAAKLRIEGGALVGEAPADVDPKLPQLFKDRFAQALKIPSSSMRPTLVEGDHIFVDKRTAPAVGDIIVYHFEDRLYVKRLIATGGHTVAESETGILVDGVPLPIQVVDPQHRWREEDAERGEHVDKTGALVRETLGTRSFLTVRTRPAQNPGEWKVPADSVFVIGDNRNNSNDSRYTGPVKTRDIVGRVTAIWLSWHDGAPDWNRMGTIPD